MGGLLLVYPHETKSLLRKIASEIGDLQVIYLLWSGSFSRQTQMGRVRYG